MGRKAGVWFWKSRKCWACTVDGKRTIDRSGIAEDDVIGAHQWWHGVRGRESIPYGTHTVEDLCEEYLDWDSQRVADGERDKRGYQVFRARLRAVCRTAISTGSVGTIRATQATHETVDESLAVWARAKCSPGYRRNLASAILTVFRFAAKPRKGLLPILTPNPLAGYKLPVTPPSHEKFAERTEAAAWLRYLWRSGVNRDYVLLQRVLIHTGARPSEWCRATTSEINWAERPMPQLVRVAWKNARKTGRSRRVYLPARIARAVRRHVEGKGADDPIFTNARGNPWRADGLARLTQTYRDRAVEAKVPIVGTGGNRMTCYRWRHTAASNLLMAGVDIATVAKLLGTSVDHVAKTYGHIQDDHVAAAASRLARPKG